MASKVFYESLIVVISNRHKIIGLETFYVIGIGFNLGIIYPSMMDGFIDLPNHIKYLVFS